MNAEKLTRMAREAGFVGFDGSNKMLRKFAALVAAAEREACAQVCERVGGNHPHFSTYAEATRDCADAIWERGE